MTAGNRLVTVVMPTFNRVDSLDRALKAIYAQTARDALSAVIVSDDGSTDATPLLLDGWRKRVPTDTPLVVLHDSNRGPAAARNRGIEKVETPWTLILGDDILLEPDAVEKMQSELEDAAAKADSVLGYVTWSDDHPVTPFMYWQEHGGCQFAYGAIEDTANAGWRFYGTALVATPTGLLRDERFDEGFPSARYEDMEFGYRLERRRKHRIRYRPNIAGKHLHPVTFIEWIEKIPSFVPSAVRLASLYPDDEGLGRTVSVTIAKELKAFQYGNLIKAARLIYDLEPQVEVPPAVNKVFGEVWSWEMLAGAYRVIQQFFFVTYLRDHLSLFEIKATDAGGLTASDMRRELMEVLCRENSGSL